MRVRCCGIQRFEAEGYSIVIAAWPHGWSIERAQQVCCLQEGHAGPHEFVEASKAREAWERRTEKYTQPLPQVADLVGLDPDFTGGLSSEDYVRKMRDGDDA